MFLIFLALYYTGTAIALAKEIEKHGIDVQNQN